jgi:hypothetical protein
LTAITGIPLSYFLARASWVLSPASQQRVVCLAGACTDTHTPKPLTADL